MAWDLGREREPGREALEQPYNDTRHGVRGLAYSGKPKEMIDRSKLFGVPCYRWIPAKSKVSIEYHCAIGQASAIPESLEEFEGATS